MPDDNYTSMDNTRIIAVKEAGIKINASVHDFNEKLSDEIKK